MLPLHAVRIEDLGQGDFMKVDCAACRHVALLMPEALLRADGDDRFWIHPLPQRAVPGRATGEIRP
jgi:hypothetical protein